MKEPDWNKLDEFPHPNPYFPAPVRPRGGLPWLVSLPLFVGGAFGVIYGFKYSSEIGDWFIAICGISFVAFLVGMISFFSSFPHMYWRFGRIIPVVVELRADKPEEQDSVGCLAGVLLPPPLGLLLWLTTSKKGNPNGMLVEYVDEGRFRSPTITAAEHWAKYGSGDIAWVCKLPMCPPVLLERVAPKNFDIPAPPEDLKQWVRKTVAGHQPLSNAKHKELRRAAKAGTKAFKRANQYDKRSG